MVYPQWKKRVDGVIEYIFPWESEKLFIKACGRFWLWRQGFKHQLMVGPYRPDFASVARKQIIEIEGRSKVPNDIVRLQEWREAREARERYLLSKGWVILYVPFYLIKNHPRQMSRGVRQWHRRPKHRITTMAI